MCHSMDMMLLGKAPTAYQPVPHVVYPVAVQHQGQLLMALKAVTCSQH